MPVIPLTKGQFAIVDAEDFGDLDKHNWYAQSAQGSGGFYAARIENMGGKRALVLMHRAINNTPAGFVTDHKNGNGLDNRKANLRTATTLQNQMNRAPNIRGTSKLKGAWFDGSSTNLNKWRSAIRINGRLKYLGRFETAEQAAAAYQRAATEYFGEFARTDGVKA